MSEGNGPPVPLLDGGVLDRLLVELDGDEGLWTIFVRGYLNQLPRRIERIRLTLTTGDIKGAMDAVLSLKTSSQMIGAERLAAHALALEQSIRDHASAKDPAIVLADLAAISLRKIRACAEQTATLLNDHLRGPESP
ncbi:Hpt domain-containing protein [Pseudarthrobacter sp902506025]|uniref:HPt (Histidine-containing phosphotransfer) domain-containing protein n=1 Tax=Pseudarthrobacter defluvii TaxID=410837 RepID=A0ABT9UFI1_9MICC|nr:Hpt domain-containing protein [Pseudarthrobacter defluvii]MDQ0118402.1 HPt (histidine-containing phosphotransfer) domain-containing protein [Pseudarthrobacter defluvii]